MGLTETAGSTGLLWIGEHIGLSIGTSELIEIETPNNTNVVIPTTPQRLCFIFHS